MGEVVKFPEFVPPPAPPPEPKMRYTVEEFEGRYYILDGLYPEFKAGANFVLSCDNPIYARECCRTLNINKKLESRD